MVNEGLLQTMSTKVRADLRQNLGWHQLQVPLHAICRHIVENVKSRMISSEVKMQRLTRAVEVKDQDEW